MRLEINALVTILGTVVLFLFGGWSMLLNVLLFVMIVDYLSGLAVACSGKSKKSKRGGLSSKVGFKGLLKKCFILVILTVAYRIDLVVNANHLLYDAVVLFYISNESISILENAALLDVPIPAKLREVIDDLREEKEDAS